MNEIPGPGSAVTDSAALLNIDELPLAYAEIDACGIITRANRAALELHHPGQGDLVGKNGWDLMSECDKDLSAAKFFSYMASGDDPPVITRPIFDRSSRFRCYELHCTLIHNRDGRPAGMRLIALDVTDLRKQLNNAHRTVHWLENALASVADAMILTDPLGFVCNANPAAEKLTGYLAHELLGKVIEASVPIVAYRPLDGPPLSRRAAIEETCRGIATILVRGGSEVKVEICTSPIHDKESGAVSGVAAVLRRIDDAR